MNNREMVLVMGRFELPTSLTKEVLLPLELHGPNCLGAVGVESNPHRKLGRFCSTYWSYTRITRYCSQVRILVEGGRIRTFWSFRNRFAVCPIWPLRNPPKVKRNVGFISGYLFQVKFFWFFYFKPCVLLDVLKEFI